MTAFPCIVRKTVRVRKTSPVLMPLSYFQPIKIKLWIIQVTFVNRYITSYKSNLLLFLHLPDSYDNLQLLSDEQISRCHAESLFGRIRFSHRSFLFYNVWRNPLWKILKNGSWHTKIFNQKKLIIQLQVFYKHVEVTLLFPLRINFPHPKYFFLCVFPGIFFEVTPVQYFPSS